MSNDYNKEYYRKNRERILARKRERYASDPKYREKVKRDVAARRAEESACAKVEVNGVMVDALKVSEFAEEVGKSVSTINNWQKHGTIPETPFRSPGGFRLYTSDMARAVKQALSMNERPSRGDKEFCGAVAQLWAECGAAP